jgi:predicted nicotinamide N-methyase
LNHRDVILRHTTVASSRLCPDISLRLITADMPLWRATEEQAANAGLVEPYWAFSWAGGQALARYVLDHPECVRDRAILDFGAGGAVEGIAAARCGGRVLAADIDPMAATAATMNAELNGVALDVSTENWVGRLDAPFDVVLAGDVFYDTAFAAAVRDWFVALAKHGADVLIGDPDRGFLDTSGLEPLARYDTPSDNDMDGSFLRPTTIYRVRRPIARAAPVASGDCR